jgi:hypothetical protein
MPAEDSRVFHLGCPSCERLGSPPRIGVFVSVTKASVYVCWRLPESFARRPAPYPSRLCVINPAPIFVRGSLPCLLFFYFENYAI